MTPCEGALASVLDEIRAHADWRCDATPDGRATIDTGRETVTSEPIRLYAKVVDERTLLVSDAGETVARLTDEGFDLNDPVHDALWRDALYAHRLETLDDRVFLQVPIERAPYLLRRMADGLVALDGLRVAFLPPVSRPRTLAGEIEEYLRSLYARDRVQASPSIRLPGGLSIRPALRVATEARSVLVQPAAASSLTQSYDHAHTLFSLAERGGVPKNERLVLLGGSLQAWNMPRLTFLSDVAYVGLWRYREPVERFLAGDIPSDPLMLPPGVDIPMPT